MRPNRSEERQPRSSADTTDLVVGLILLVLVPVGCLLIAGMLGVSAPPKYLFREKPKVDPPLDAAEVEMRFQAAEKLYVENGKAYLELAQNRGTSGYLGRFLDWTERSLRDADSAFGDLATWIQRFPETGSRFGGYVTRIGQRRAEIARDLEVAKSLRVLR